MQHALDISLPFFVEELTSYEISLVRAKFYHFNGLTMYTIVLYMTDISRVRCIVYVIQYTNGFVFCCAL